MAPSTNTAVVPCANNIGPESVLVGASPSSPMPALRSPVNPNFSLSSSPVLYPPPPSSLFSSELWAGRSAMEAADPDSFFGHHLPAAGGSNGIMGSLLNENNAALMMDPWRQATTLPVQSFSSSNGFAFDTRFSGFINHLVQMGGGSGSGTTGPAITTAPNMNPFSSRQSSYHLTEEDEEEPTIVMPAEDQALTVNSQEEGSSCQRDSLSAAADAKSSKKRKCGSSRDFIPKPNKDFKAETEAGNKGKRCRSSYTDPADDEKAGEMASKLASNHASETVKQLQTSNSGTSGESESPSRSGKECSKPSAYDQPSTKPDFIHVRARRGQATDSHSLAERVRREKISERMKILQDLVPGCSKVTGKAMMLDEIINYVQSLQRQVEFLSMKLAALNPRLDYQNIESFVLSKEVLPNRTHASAFAPEVMASPYSLPSTTTSCSTNTSQASLMGAPLNGTITTSAAAVASATHPSIRSLMMMMGPTGFDVGDDPAQVQQVWGDELHHVVQHMGGHASFTPLASDQPSGLVGSIAALKAEM